MPTLNKILIIRFSSLGDILLATPLIRSLRKAYPGAIIDFCVKAAYTEILRTNPNLSSVIELHSSEFGELKSLKKRLRRERYDLVVDLHNSIRSRYLRAGLGARDTTVVRKYAIRRFALVRFKKNTYKRIVPVPERYLETVRRFGVLPDGLGLEVNVPDEVVASVAGRLERSNLGRYRTVIGFVPSARHFTKCWLPERFVELGKRFARDDHAKILLFGGREESDYCADIAQLINADLGYTAAENMAGSLTLLENAAAFDFCRIAITNDTGLMHLAAARGITLVAIFGSTVRELGFFPYGTNSTVVEEKDLSCRPCTAIGRAACPEGHFRCMKDISADRVYRAGTRTESGGGRDRSRQFRP